MAATVNNDDNFNIDDIVKDHLTNLQNCLNECIYYTDTELQESQCKVNTFSTLSINCRRLSKHFDKLESSIKSLNCNFDCIGLTETWLKDMENTDIYNIPDYILLSNPRTKKRWRSWYVRFK